MTTPKRIRYVAILGLGQFDRDKKKNGYSKLRYRHPDNGQVSEKTPFVQEALRKFYDYPDDECYVIGTRAVWKTWNDSANNTARTSFQRRFGKFRRMVVPNGETNAQLIQLFETVRAALEGRVKDVGEHDYLRNVYDVDPTAKPNMSDIEEIHFDVTHGFRIQPIIGLAALEFMRADWQRKEIERPPRVRVTYGAYEARTGEKEEAIAPIWDLSSLIDVGRWNQAISVLLLHGNADELSEVKETATFEADLFLEELDTRFEERTDENGRPLPVTPPSESESAEAERKSQQAEDWFQSLAEEMEVLVGAMDTVLLPDISDAAAHLNDAISHGGQTEFLHGYPMFADTIDTLDSWATGLSPAARNTESTIDWFRTISSLDGLKSALRLMEIYRTQRRFAEMLIVLRESLITLYGLLKGYDIVSDRTDVDREFGGRSPGYYKKRCKERETDENPIVTDGQALSGMSSHELADEVLVFGERARNVRNQLTHAGMRSKRDTPNKIIDDIETTAELFDTYLTAAITSLGRANPEDSETQKASEQTLFIISNHPFETWPEAQQQKAAKKWKTFDGYAAAMKDDNKLPALDAIDPSADGRKIANIYAGPIYRYVKKKGYKHVFVNGEHRLTVALVAVLQHEGIECYTGTTRREVVAEANETASSTTTRKFTFDSFQDYPNIPRLYSDMDRADS